ncbi:MAG TPA: RNA chaperone Hfq [Acidobacteriota bacterium]|nr:RNA chaperone Hfq [Acidobacteriota bacterium]
MSELRDQTTAKYANAQRKRVPPKQTNAEQYYYLKQMTAKTPMVVKLIDGEELRGVIEWYDEDCIKVNREGDPNLLVPKHAVKYMYKENEENDGDAQPDYDPSERAI